MALLQDLIKLDRPQQLHGKEHRRTLPNRETDPSKLPAWNYAGSSTDQAPGDNSDRVACDAYTPAGEPIPTNKMFNAVKISSHLDVTAEEPSYGIEQEYTLLKKALPLEFQLVISCGSPNTSSRLSWNFSW